MSEAPQETTQSAPPMEQAALPAATAMRPLQRAVRAGVVVLAVVALLMSAMLWFKLSNIQEQLARQSADSGATSQEARAQARQAQELARDTAAKLAIAENRLNEAALQRAQLEELMKSLSRSRDENLVVDIESALLLAQQQSQLTGSLEPLLAALKGADQRLQRAAQPRLAPLQRAIARDLDRIKAVAVADTPTLLLRMDELVRMADELPLANAVGKDRLSAQQPKSAAQAAAEGVWPRLWAQITDEARRLVRVSRVEHPDAVLITPEQSYFVRENLKLKLLNARLGLLARQTESVRLDLQGAEQALTRYFDASSKRTQTAAQVLNQVQGQLKNLDLPRLDGSLAALSTAAAGR